MLFLAFAFVFISTIAGLIWLFVLDPLYGIIGLVAILVLFILLSIKVMRSKKLTEKKAVEEFHRHLQKIYESDKATRIYDELGQKLGKRQLYNSIRGVNEKFKSSSEAGNEELRMVLNSVTAANSIK